MMTTKTQSSDFVHRHLGPSEDEVEAMLREIGVSSLDALIGQTIPKSIRSETPEIPAMSEVEALRALRGIASSNESWRTFIGQGYHGTVVPAVIQRNILENPGWYTQYTPYQAEIAQGRLEALLNFQTMVCDLTGMEVSNASLLDEATAAAEAMVMCVNITRRKVFRVAPGCHEQTIDVLRTRARALDIDLRLEGDDTDCAGVLFQDPTTEGRAGGRPDDYAKAKDAGALVVVATDLMACTLFTPPGEQGADIVIGSSQRFGVPMGAGGPHAAFLATHESHIRRMPGRIIGVSKDAEGDPAYRMAIQTREQHIKRDRATSNICTAQALLAIMASMYAVYHGPEGLRRIATGIRRHAEILRASLRAVGVPVRDEVGFDTVVVEGVDCRTEAESRRLNFAYRGKDVSITLDETTTLDDVRDIVACFGDPLVVDRVADEITGDVPDDLARTSAYLTHPVFHEHRSETEMLRYMSRLQSRDLSLAQSMIPLGSCTMKLNATSEMLPVTWSEFAHHPFVPREQQEGTFAMCNMLERWLCDLTGFDAISLQPNAGSQGEYAGLLVIRAYHESRGDTERDVCLIPMSAHGTNPASAVAAGFKVVGVKCDEDGNIDIEDLRARAEQHADRLGALMITYPSTHGVFEEAVVEICELIHAHGGQVYLDGANMNAQVGLARPGAYGADVCHLNLHKTFCIPHGGGGPGMGPIGVGAHIAPFLPDHPVVRPDSAGDRAVGAIAAAPYGSPSILPISWMYIAMMGSAGLRRATEIAILGANYMAKRLEGHFDILYRGANGRCAHEFILDCRSFEKTANVRVEDIAKRLMDFGFHAPTISFPVAGTLMIEPTESESRAELDRYCDALIAIREEIRAIETGASSRDDNPLINAPHTIEMIASDEWTHAYPRSQAGFPLDWLRDHKFWPPVARIDNPYGDRNLICTCPTVEELA